MTQIIYNITVEIKQRSDTMSQRRDIAFKAIERTNSILNLSPEEIEIAQKIALREYGYDDELESEIHKYIEALNEASKKYGDELLRLRTSKKLSRDRASEIFKIPATTLGRLENGTNVPSVTAALAIAKYYGKTVEEIFGVK